MRVLVTGGLGFLGRAVTLDLLAHGHQVTVMSRGVRDVKPPAGAEVVTGDIRDRDRVAEVVRDGHFDGVCHLAALTSGRDSLADPLTYFDVNTGGTLNLLMALDAVKTDRQPPALVFTSTNIVYGSAYSGALSEDLPPHPESPYAASKVAAEQLVAAYAATGAIGAITLRPFNIAGAVDGVTDTDPGRIIPNIFRAITGEIPHVTLNGDGSAVRDFVHVLDVASAVRFALQACRPGSHLIYNVGSGTGVSMAELVATAEQITGRPITVKRNPPKIEPPALIAEVARVRAQLDWQPRRSTPEQVLSDVSQTWDLS